MSIRFKKMRGMYLVEFAIVAKIGFFIVLFLVLEVGRFFFTINVLNESVRRGARLAAVCNIDDARILQRAVFAETDQTTSTIIGNLSTADLTLRYLDENGGPVGAGAFSAIRFVEVGIAGFRFNFLVPLIGTGIDLQPFRAVLPRESLGRTPESPEITPC